MTDQYDDAIIGAGQACGPLATALAGHGQRVAHIERAQTQAYYGRELSPELNALYAQGRIDRRRRPYAEGDLDRAGLAVVATNIRAVNAAVAQAARIRGILCNVVDAPNEGNFHTPAVYRGRVGCRDGSEDGEASDRGEVVIAVGTGGKSPGRAAELRDRIAQFIAG